MLLRIAVDMETPWKVSSTRFDRRSTCWTNKPLARLGNSPLDGKILSSTPRYVEKVMQGIRVPPVAFLP
jgi:hypothetical protein